MNPAILSDCNFHQFSARSHSESRLCLDGGSYKIGTSSLVLPPTLMSC